MCLDSPFERNAGHSTKMHKNNLELLYHLIAKYRPKKIVEFGTKDDNLNIELTEMLYSLHMKSQLYTLGFTKSGQEKLKPNFQKMLEEIGSEIDFLILNSYSAVPDEILDFLVIFPYLTKDAIVILFDTVVQYKGSPSLFASSVLFRNIVAAKFNYYLAAYPNLIERLELLGAYPSRNISFASEIIVGFQITSDTRKHIADLFIALSVPWSYMPKEESLERYERILESYYDQECLCLYRHAVKSSKCSLNSAEKMLNEAANSLFRSYQYLLVFGKRERGKLLLNLCKDLGIEIHGFVISDGRISSELYEGLPVYSFSHVPFEKNDTLIINTTNSDQVKLSLKTSKYHWMDFSQFVLSF